MTIADQINRLNNAKAAIKQSLENKGVTVSDSALLDEYPALINSIPMEGGDPYYEEFYNLRTSNGTNMAGLFSYCKASELDLSNLDTSKATNMNYMFNNCKSLVNVDGWDTSKVTNMEYMFYYFSGSIDVSKLDTSKVIDAGYMFSNANTDNIILTGLSFPKATSLDYMFYNATGTTLDLSSWDISNITNMSYMFAGSYKKIDLTGWKTTNVTNMTRIFYKSSNPLEELIIPDWDMTNCSHNIFNKSSYIPNLKLIDLSRSNDATIIKIASYLPTRTVTTFGTVLVPENTSQEAYDALIAKYWAPIGAAIGTVPTSCNIVAELDEIMPGKSTKVYLDACEPWNADLSKVEIVALDESIATIDEDNIVTSTGVLGDIILEARIIDTKEVIGAKTIVVSETDSYPNLVKFRAASVPSSYDTVITVNGSTKKLSDLTYDSITDIYSYDAGVPITSIKFSSSSNISELVKLNISNITDMYEMFYYCQSLTSLDVSGFDTSNVVNMSLMFSRCKSLTSLDLSSFDTSNVEHITSMFYECTLLTTLDLSDFNLNNIVGDTDGMFFGCNSLQELHLDNCSNNTISKIINNSEFPTNAIDGVIRTIYCKESEAAGLTAPTNWVFSYVEEEPEVPEEPPVEDIPLYTPGEFEYDTIVTEVKTMVDESHDDLSYMFNGCTNLVSVNTEDWDTSNVENMNNMFYNCTSLTQLDLSNFDISNVIGMNFMFEGCMSLTTLNLSNWEISPIIMPEWDMNDMFLRCASLHTLRLDNCSNDTISKIIKSIGFPTNAISGVTRTIYCKEENIGDLVAPTNWVFSFITEEAEGDISLYEVGQYKENMGLTEVKTMVNESHTDLSEMFLMCMKLESVNTQDWTITNVTNMSFMFFNCRALQSLDLSNWDMTNVTNTENMFDCCSSLHTLRLDNCNNDTISKIINSSKFPTNAIEGVTRYIYCSDSAATGLEAPENWHFYYI